MRERTVNGPLDYILSKRERNVNGSLNYLLSKRERTVNGSLDYILCKWERIINESLGNTPSNLLETTPDVFTQIPAVVDRRKSGVTYLSFNKYV
jgi:hypothetical protein